MFYQSEAISCLRHSKNFVNTLSYGRKNLGNHFSHFVQLIINSQTVNSLQTGYVYIILLVYVCLIQHSFPFCSVPIGHVLAEPWLTQQKASALRLWMRGRQHCPAVYSAYMYFTHSEHTMHPSCHSSALWHLRTHKSLAQCVQSNTCWQLKGHLSRLNICNKDTATHYW